MVVVASALLAGAAGAAHAQTGPKNFDFSIANIMRGPENYGREPGAVRWTLDGKWVYFTWLEPGTDWRVPARCFAPVKRASVSPPTERQEPLQQPSAGL